MKTIQIGDKIRFSVELIKDIDKLPDRATVLVAVADITEDAEGVKYVSVSTVRVENPAA